MSWWWWLRQICLEISTILLCMRNQSLSRFIMQDSLPILFEVIVYNLPYFCSHFSQLEDIICNVLNCSSVSLSLGVLMSWESSREGHGRGARARGEIFLKQGRKQGLLTHFEQIVKCDGGHSNSPLCTVSRFKHPRVIWVFWVCSQIFTVLIFV